MGYLSDVCICIKKDSVSKLSEKLTIGKPGELKQVGALIESADHMTDPVSGDELWHWTDVKWCQTNEDVSFMASIMAELDLRDYLFLRIGEDTDDNEVQGFYWNNPFALCLERRICFERPSYGNC